MWSLAEKDNIHEAGASYQEEDEHVFAETRQEKLRCSRRTQYCEDMEFLQKERLRDREKMLLWSPSRNEENMWEKLAKTIQDAHINVECLQKARTKQGSVRGWLYCGVLAVAVLLQRWRRRHRCPPVSQWGPGSTRHPLIHPQIFFKMSRRMIAASIVQRDIPYDKIWDFFQVIKFNVILKHSISNSKFRTGHELLFNVVLPIHPSCPFKSVKSFNGVNQTQMIDCQPESCVTQKAECIDWNGDQLTQKGTGNMKKVSSYSKWIFTSTLLSAEIGNEIWREVIV